MNPRCGTSGHVGATEVVRSRRRSLSGVRAGLVVLAAALASAIGPGSLSGQARTVGAAAPRGPVSGAGLLYIDLGSGDGPTPALELTFTDQTPRMWRAGLTAGLISSVRGTVYGYGGLQLPIPLPLGLLARPSISAGFYSSGEGFDLGHAVEFRSALLVERRITDHVRLSTVFFHLSNAGFGRTNPGMEALGFGVSVGPPGRP